MKRTYGLTEKRTPQQHARLFALLNKLGYDSDTRHTLVHSFTNGRSTSSRDLFAHEANSLIHHLEQQLPREDSPLFNVRRKLFAVAHELGWELPDGKVDRDRLERFILERGVVRKPFLELDAKELGQTVTQLEQISAKQHRRG